MGTEMCMRGLLMILFTGFSACITPVDPALESQRLAQIKNAQMGVPLDAPVRAAHVTYVIEKGEDPINDPGGFFLQAHPHGTALFFPFGPEDIQPYPQVGDVVQFRAIQVLDEELWLSSALWESIESTEAEVSKPGSPTRWFTDEEETALRTYLRQSKPEMLKKVEGVLNGRLAMTDFNVVRRAPVKHLVTDLTSEQELSRNVDPFTDRLVTIRGVIRSDFKPHGKGFRTAMLGVKEQAAMSGLWFRVPEILIEERDLRKGCTVRIGPTPLRRFRDTPVFSAYHAKEVVVENCPSKAAEADLRTNEAPTQEGQVVITELMVRANSVPGRPGQWIEVHNPESGFRRNLKGCYLVPENPREQYLMTADVTLEPGGFVVLANNELPGGFSTEYSYGDAFDLRGESGRVRVAVRCGRSVIAKVDLPLQEQAGVSYALGGLDTNGKRKWCLGRSVYNRSEGKDDKGTPGQKNDCK